MSLHAGSKTTKKNGYTRFRSVFHERVSEENISGFYKLFPQSTLLGEIPRVVMDYYKNEVFQYDEENCLPEADRYQRIAITGEFILGSYYSKNPDFWDGMTILTVLLQLVELRLHANSWRMVKTEEDVFKIFTELKSITDWAAIWLVWETVFVTIGKIKNIDTPSVFVAALKAFIVAPSKVDGIIRKDFR
jgi:hypothetical protein